MTKYKLKFTKYLLSLIIDFAFVLILTYLTKEILNLVIIINYARLFIIFVIINSLYSFIFYHLYKATIGKLFFGISININTEKPLLTILYREIVIKLFFSLILLFIIFTNSDVTNIKLYTRLIISIIFFAFIPIVNLILIKIFNKSIIDIIARTSINFVYKVKINNYRFYYKYILLFVASFLLILITNNAKHKSELSLLGINLPDKFPEYPYNDTFKYNDFLKDQKTATDYIFYLFEKNDIVVICEPNHFEIKNWDFILNIVSDKRFIKNVGNVFTEYGSVIQQNKIDSFLIKKYSNEKAIEKATANITCFRNNGFYNYIKSINVLNSDLKDSLKIRHFFCDIKGFSECPRSTVDSFSLNNRDSLMAQVLIDKYKNQISKENRNKCLLITDYRHAYNLYKYDNKNQAEFIFTEFPNKTANVLINSYVMTFPFFLFYPIQDGKWDLVFKNNQNKQIGFDFANSPFGNDNFDHYVRPTPSTTYQDVFTGFVFINSSENWGFNYRTESTIFINLYNLFPLLLVVLLNLFSVVIIISSFIRFILKSRLQKK